MLNPETFEELRMVLTCQHIRYQRGIRDVCLQCGKHKALDERWPLPETYTPLLALVQEKCSQFSSVFQNEAGFYIEELPHKQHCRCLGIGYISRFDYWEAVPDGAWEGVLIKAIAAGGFRVSADVMLGGLLITLRGLLSYCEGDTRQEATEAVLAWVKGEA